MQLARSTLLRWGMASVFFFVISFACAGCRIRAREPYWIETHGSARGYRIAGWANGVLLLGGDTHLWVYPGEWANPWVAKAQTRPLRALGAASNAAYALLNDGRVARYTGSWSPIEGSASWGASEISVSEDEHLLVIANGKLRMFDRDGLRPLGCDDIGPVAVAATHGEGAFVLDKDGALFFNGDGHCDPIAAPVRLQRIAATPERLLAVDVDGVVWRRRANVWNPLPAPFKCRVGQAPFTKPAVDVAVSAYSTWLADSEGSVFILSDENEY